MYLGTRAQEEQRKTRCKGADLKVKDKEHVSEGASQPALISNLKRQRTT
jgi:hypothetical protein